MRENYEALTKVYELCRFIFTAVGNIHRFFFFSMDINHDFIHILVVEADKQFKHGLSVYFNSNVHFINMPYKSKPLSWWSSSDYVFSPLPNVEWQFVIRRFSPN